MKKDNFHEKTIASFGDEWSRHQQSNLDPAELEKIFDDYFHIVPWELLPPNAIGFDMGTGTGRWAQLVAPRLSALDVIDASEQALKVAKKNLSSCDNIRYHHANTNSVKLETESFDFGYSLGVLHHIPDTNSAIKDCVRLLKPGGIFLIYLYYRFDNRPAWFCAIWRLSDILRRFIHPLPPVLKSVVTDLLAFTIYWPLSRFSALIEKFGFDPSMVPLSAYRAYSINTLRTDSRDRFGTPLEKRFTKNEIKNILHESGLSEIKFSERSPFWCAVGIKRKSK